MDLAVVKDARARAVNEVDPPGDVAVFEVLPAVVDHQRVLPGDDAAIGEHVAVAVDAQRQRLAVITRRVLDR